MIHEHDDLVLASAAIDFELTEAEAAQLRRAVADCPICAERAAAYRRQFQLLADMPKFEPSDALRRRVMAAAIAGRPPQTRAPMLLLAAALAIGAVLALLAVAAGGGWFKQRTIAEFPPNDQSVAPISSGIAIASSDPSAPVSPSVEPVPSGPPGAFGTDTVAQVISTNLRLRSQPRIAADSIKFEPFLTIGDRLFVVAGPVVASNHDWYQVAAWRPSDATATWPIGWVATADVDGTPWIGPARTTCPGAPTVDVLAAMNRFEALACYGNRTIAVRALVSGAEPGDPCPGEQTTACLSGPTWLAGTGGRTAAVDARSAGASPPSNPLAIARDPAGPVSENDLPPGRMVRIEGSFDSPAASTCTIKGAPASISTLTVTDAILRCRTTFVVTAATPDPAYLTVESAAVTTTPDLRVRSLPLVDDSSVRYEPLLDQGTRLFVLEGPVLGSGYDWYRVLVPAVTRADGQPMSGWVAVAGKTGEIWAQDVALGCPPVDGQVALSEIARLGSGSPSDGGVSCFGSVPLTTTATVALTCVGPDATATSTTNWLGLPARMTVHLSDGSAAFDARVSPDLAGRTSCDPPPDGRWLVQGHFDDPAASACEAGAASDSAAELARYRCRAIFVVTALTAAP